MSPLGLPAGFRSRSPLSYRQADKEGLLFSPSPEKVPRGEFLSKNGPYLLTNRFSAREPMVTHSTEF